MRETVGIARCSLLRVRAGIFLQDECLDNLSRFFRDSEIGGSVRLLIYAKPTDAMAIRDLATALNVVGKDSVLIDFPAIVHEKLRKLSAKDNNDDDAVDDETDRVHQDLPNAGAVKIANMLMILFAQMVLLK